MGCLRCLLPQLICSVLTARSGFELESDLTVRLWTTAWYSGSSCLQWVPQRVMAHAETLHRLSSGGCRMALFLPIHTLPVFFFKLLLRTCLRRMQISFPSLFSWLRAQSERCFTPCWVCIAACVVLTEGATSSSTL